MMNARMHAHLFPMNEALTSSCIQQGSLKFPLAANRMCYYCNILFSFLQTYFNFMIVILSQYLMVEFHKKCQ